MGNTCSNKILINNNGESKTASDGKPYSNNSS
jgi:hypothetical protein